MNAQCTPRLTRNPPGTAMERTTSLSLELTQPTGPAVYCRYTGPREVADRNAIPWASNRIGRNEYEDFLYWERNRSKNTDIQ